MNAIRHSKRHHNIETETVANWEVNPRRWNRP